MMAALVGCTDNATTKMCTNGSGDACLTLPTAPLLAHPTAMTTGAPVLGCGPLQVMTSTMATVFSGAVLDYQNSATMVGGASITIYSQADFTGQLVTATSAADGTYSFTLPSGSPNVLFAKVTAANYVDAYYVNGHFDVTKPAVTFNFTDVRTDSVGTLYGLVRETPDPTKATLAIVADDCNRAPLEHAIGVISSTSKKRTLVAGAGVYYTAHGTFPAPVLTSVQPDTTETGLIASVNVPVTGSLYLQVWGFPDATAQAKGEAGLELVAEYPLTLFASEAAIFAAYANQ